MNKICSCQIAFHRDGSKIPFVCAYSMDWHADGVLVRNHSLVHGLLACNINSIFVRCMSVIVSCQLRQCVLFWLYVCTLLRGGAATSNLLLWLYFPVYRCRCYLYPRQFIFLRAVVLYMKILSLCIFWGQLRYVFCRLTTGNVADVFAAFIFLTVKSAHAS